MLQPEAQKLRPFFLVGRDILVSDQTDEMDHEEKLRSMRGNTSRYSN